MFRGPVADSGNTDSWEKAGVTDRLPDVEETEGHTLPLHSIPRFDIPPPLSPVAFFYRSAKKQE